MNMTATNLEMVKTLMPVFPSRILILINNIKYIKILNNSATYPEGLSSLEYKFIMCSSMSFTENKAKMVGEHDSVMYLKSNAEKEIPQIHKVISP